MADFSKAILVGRLVANPELKATASNVQVCSFTIAVNRRFSKQGEQSVTDFFDIVTWRSTAEFVSKYFTKGQAILVCGSLQTRMWEDKNGSKHKSVEIVADEVQFAEPKRDSASYQQSAPAQEPTFAAGNDDFTELADDDELPF